MLEGRARREEQLFKSQVSERTYGQYEFKSKSISKKFDVPCFPSPSAYEGLRVFTPGLDQNTKPIPSLEGPILVVHGGILQQLQDAFPMAAVDQEREWEDQRLEFTINMDG